MAMTKVTTNMLNQQLTNVDNTSDANKPVSVAQAAANATVLSTSQTYSDNKVAALVASSPATLDTLNELAAALGNDANFATTTATALGNRLRVDIATQGLNGTQKTNAKTNIDLNLVDNTSDATKNSATATFTNKTISGSSNTITNVSLTAGVAGTLPIANGGTNATTANAALNNLLPTQTSNSGKVLTTNGTNTSWASAGASVAPKVTPYLTGSGTHALTGSPLYIKVRMVGGGAGGAGGGSTGGAGGGGVTSTFGTSLLVSNGGAGGAFTSSGGAGGTASLGTGPIGFAISGGGGGGSGTVNVAYALGGTGGNSFFGGGGYGTTATAGGAGAANTGGGGGGGSNNGTTVSSGSGGGAGGYVEGIITIPAASYSYAVGSGGAGGTAGANGFAGGAGAAGIIIVEEFYQ